ncbi:MAG: helix-turn-helix transcriptional regulator [Leptolyngbyaceae cyanobacterium RM2_2_4]|nr:helix-turn-helix transcriptional regulator [Leptolyngbyaceae cyanobacterium SM1_4_3]NJM00212.1 helix-turn-helix transcriptional regulator [Synechococcaceae cyanobacterium SM2_3_2]NJN92317.1 helix-turn-helix transcriptional regulator [Leptolyngbyaceae cyanobacterium SL_5_14]NJO53359.1 helix-turn-helix transcriptional regulator [Leptolyngbyaceae cyanobacterium RM2_2_4]
MAESECAPLEKLLNQISGQWTMYILWILDTNGTMRFGELRRKVDGISPKVLTQRLRMLEEIGIIHRSYASTIPPQVSYGLTERGKELSKPLYDLCDLASRWYGDETTT